MTKQSEKITKRQSRRNRIRAKVVGTSERPRLSVFRSNRFVALQLIDDVSGKTLAAVSDAAFADKKTKTEKAKMAGMELAKLAVAKKIKNAVFDKGGYKYHGRVKAVADGAREGGLAF